MKKLLVLTLVLGIASLATAGLVFTDNGDVGLGASSLGITIATPGDGGVPVDYTGDYRQYIVSADATVAAVSEGTITLGDISWDKTVYENPSYPSYATTYYLYPAMTDAGLATDGSVSANHGNLAASSGGAMNGEGSTFSINALSAGTLTLWESAEGGDGSWTAVDTITIVPEPATMVLLGLGALVLRRKK